METYQDAGILPYIQQILGHKIIRSTEIYTKVDKEDLKKVFDKYHPRRFKKKEDKEDENNNNK